MWHGYVRMLRSKRVDQSVFLPELTRFSFLVGAFPECSAVGRELPEGFGSKDCVLWKFKSLEVYVLWLVCMFFFFFNISLKANDSSLFGLHGRERGGHLGPAGLGPPGDGRCQGQWPSQLWQIDRAVASFCDSFCDRYPTWKVDTSQSYSL